jgi:hypothetical protein
VGKDVDLMKDRLGAAGGGGETIQIIRTTGNRDLDRALDRSLVRMSTTFGIDPVFGFFEDKQPNAFAAPESNDLSRTGIVLFGRNLFNDLQATDPSGVSVLGVAAHEFAHIWQFHSGYYKVIRGNGPTVKRLELNADFLAGYYLGLRKSAVPWRLALDLRRKALGPRRHERERPRPPRDASRADGRRRSRLQAVLRREERTWPRPSSQAWTTSVLCRAC